jgi:ubiquinone/menaquinone biosynthesis C-methylase UbiE
MDARTMLPLRDFAAGSAGGRVIEIGCGTGLNFLHYDWANVEALEATEPDPFMFRRAEVRMAALEPEQRAKVSLHDAPAEALPFPDASFDAAVATLVFCTVSDLDRALGEVRRLLRPGGQLRLVEHVKATGATARVQRVVQPVYGRISGGCQLSRETEAAVRRSGFELEITQRTKMGGPLWPVFVGIATKA